MHARPQAFGVGIKKHQKICFGEIKSHRLAIILDQAMALPLDDQRRMAYLACYGNQYVRQLILGTAHHFASLHFAGSQIAVQRSFGVPLKWLKSYEGARILNNPNCP